MKEKKLEFYGGEWISFMPIALFVFLIILTTFFCGSTSNGATWVPAFVSLLCPLFLAKDKKAYAEAIIGGISDKNAAIPISCWIFSGIQISPFMFYVYISMIVMILVTYLGIGRNGGRQIKQ